MLDLDTATLLVGFNRPELLEKRLREISEFPNLTLFVTIDGPRIKSNDNESNEEILKILERWEKKLNITSIIHKENIGLALNITTAIENILQIHERVFVIEDDVSVTKDAYKAIVEMQFGAKTNIATVGGFGFLSPLSKIKKFGLRNYFRSTPYFSAWGWCIDRANWQNYQLDLSNIDLERDLNDSKLWKSLSVQERLIWRRRFGKVIKNPMYTWDFQMQFMTFKFDKLHHLPYFRIIDNEGFNDVRGTNIKGRIPNWYRGEKPHIDIENTIRVKNGIMGKIWITMDKFTWVGIRKIKYRRKH